jgi:predicted AAA+ superfamily ATPase
LFLYEVQAAPELLSKLRCFAEDAPVIATGSLLDFTLAKYQYSMPVGRMNYVHLELLSFEEFSMAYNKKKLF